ncbi:glutamate-cysteine ligase family protein [Bradyrhizobium sp. WSM1743]|uniref:glutamate-cysteine ligase family protein n=1 Tax=Bradyrhizobium sp. WSM1743 TaxID=318996 RepID=UPI0018DEC8CC|nr:glutamate-cysteine ligase family protein [Bradyrhizobium sp. WSM1743]
MTGHGSGFRFGLEAEFLLVEAVSCRPLWHPELRFEELNLALEAIGVSDFDQEGLDLIPLHRKRMPFVVEGYQLPGPDLKPTALLPKGVEIRTPICTSVEECVATFATLHGRMQRSLSERGYRAATLSFHPIEDHFEGPQNKRRYDHWQWAMEAMTTYGPDINVSVPPDVAAQLDLHELHAKVNYYAPALTALTVASPLYRGDLWRIRGNVGKSVRTYHRSTIAPAISIHPKENLRLEFKPLEMTSYLLDYQAYFLLWLALILDERSWAARRSKPGSTTWDRLPDLASKQKAPGSARMKSCQRRRARWTIGVSIAGRSIIFVPGWRPDESPPMTSSISSSASNPYRTYCVISSIYDNAITFRRRSDPGAIGADDQLANVRRR